MGIQKSFVIKNGLEVNTDLIFADADKNMIGIGTTNPSSTLDVNGTVDALNLNVSGISTLNYISAGGTIGSPGQVLTSTGAGIAWTGGSNRVIKNYVADVGQTVFPLEYNVGLVDVYVNGVRLSYTEYTADDGLTVVLDDPCFGGENVEIIANSSLPSGIASAISGISILDEGVVIGSPLSITSINFVGSGVTAVPTPSGIGVSVLVSPITVSTRNGISGINSSDAVTNVKAIRFDSTTGFGVTDLGNGEVFVDLGSSFATIYVDGYDDLKATGEDTIEYIAGPGIAITTKSTSSGVGTGLSKAITFSSTGGGGGGSSQWVTTDVGIHTLSNVGIGTTNPTSSLTVSGDGYFTGVVTANAFVGDGSGLTNLPSGGGGSSQWVTTYVGIHTLSNVGIGTTNPRTALEVNGVLGFGTFFGGAYSGPYTNIRIGDSTTANNLVFDGGNNIFMGIGAGSSANGSYNNNFIGFKAGYYSNYDNNNFFGFYSGYFNSGWGNNIFGRCAGYCNLGRCNNIFGWNAGKYNSGCNNNFLGKEAGYCTSGDDNNFLGSFTGYSNISGYYNNFLGSFAGYNNTTAENNNFLGSSSGYNNTTGTSNNFFGVGSGYNNTIGSCNNFFGYSSGYYNTTGTRNTFIGYNTGISTSASYKVILGSGNFYNFDSPDTTKSYQFAVGVRTTSTLSAPSKYWLVGNENFNIGIGTTNPTSKLHVGGDVRVTGVVTANAFVGDGSGLTNLPSGGGGSSQWVTTSVGIHTLSNVGIGTTNPTVKLYVEGDARVTGVLSVGQGTITLNGNTDTIITPNLDVGIGGTILKVSNCNIGIGTTNPTSKLHVRGDGYYTGVVTATKFIGDGSGITSISQSLSSLSDYSLVKLPVDSYEYTINKGEDGYAQPTANGEWGSIHSAGDSLYIRLWPSDITGTPFPISDFGGLGGYPTNGMVITFVYSNATTVTKRFYRYQSEVWISQSGYYQIRLANQGIGYGLSSMTIDSNSTYTVPLADKDALIWSEFDGKWQPKSVLTSTSSINALTDVDTSTTSPTSGQTLIWNGTNWVPGTSSQWVTTSVGIHTLSNVGVGTTNPTSKLTVVGDSKFGGVIETVSTATTYLSGASLVLELDVRAATTYTYTIPTGANIGIVSFKNMPAQTGKQSGSTITCIFTQNSAGTGNTTAATGIGTNITVVGYENGASVAGISTRAFVGSGTTVTLSSTASDRDFVSFFIHYNGGTNTSASSYSVYATKNGGFR